MQPLEKVKQQFQILGGLDQMNANGGLDGPGDHARASGTFLTGVRVKKTAGADIHAGVSVDQVAAQRVGHLTRFPSLELTCDGVRKSGNCDSGYSCAYQFNLSWSTPTMPVAPEPNPRLVFERLFGAGSPGERRKNLELRREQQRSILDFVLDDTRALERQLGRRDQQKLDEYLTSVREIEGRIERGRTIQGCPEPRRGNARRHPGQLPGAHPAHVRHDDPGLPDRLHPHRHLPAGQRGEQPHVPGHRDLRRPPQPVPSLRKKETMDKIAEIDLWYVEQFARFLEKLDAVKDVDGHSLLHNSMIVYGSGNGDGNRHTHTNLPLILAGRAGGVILSRTLSQVQVQADEQPVPQHARFGVDGVPRLGDSTGRVEGI